MATASNALHQDGKTYIIASQLIGETPPACELCALDGLLCLYETSPCVGHDRESGYEFSHYWVETDSLEEPGQ